MAHAYRLCLTALTLLLLATLEVPAFAETTSSPAKQTSNRHSAHQPRCRLDTLKGRYGLLIQGVRPAPGGGTEAMISTVVMSFDGRGEFTQVGSVHAATTGVITGLRGSGSYHLAADCSGGFTLQNEGFPFAIDARIVVVDDGQAFFLVTTTRLQPAPMGPEVPILVSGTGRRM